jgi:hypothetical protein
MWTRHVLGYMRNGRRTRLLGAGSFVDGSDALCDCFGCELASMWETSSDASCVLFCMLWYW